MKLQVSHLDHSFGKRQILKDVSFEAPGGEVLSILGPNGVGKSTLFRCILGLLRPGAGTVKVDGVNVAELSARALAQRIAYIPQSHSSAFNYTVLEMVLMGTASQLKPLEAPKSAQRRAAQDALERLRIGQLAEQPYGFCSGGERQLCLIARALAQQARILIMDEPSASLDLGNRIRVMQTVRELAADGYAVVQTTHDPEQAYLYSDKILALHDGRVLAWGTPQTVVTDERMSTLYGTGLEVHSLHGDAVRVCVPVNMPGRNGAL